MPKHLVSVVLLAAAIAHGPTAAQDDPAAQAARSWRQRNEQRILGEYLELLRIPNVSRDLANVRRNAEHLLAMMRRRGLDPRLLEIPGAAPLVYGERLVAGAASTYVFYAHYDGQPVDAREWATPPFEPVLRTARIDQGGEIVTAGERGARPQPEWRIYARSASDDKAPIMAMLSALDALDAAGMRPRANLKFVFEGEEEIGSPHLGAFLAAHRELLRGDAWIICDGPEHASGRTTVVLGVRGIQGIDLTVYGANRDLHSGQYGNWAPNPAMMLSRLLASLMDDDGRVLIQHFYDDAAPLGAAELAALADFPDTDAEEMRTLGLARSHGNGKRLEVVARPALNVTGLSSGRTGTEAVNAIPASATARLDVRLVKGMSREVTLQRLHAHLRTQGFYVTDSEPDAATRLKHARIVRVSADPAGYHASRTPLDHPVAQRVIATLRGVRAPLLLQPTIGGSVPLAVIEEALGVPTITVPTVNHDNNQHAKDENLRLGNLWNAIEVQAALLTMP